MSEQLAGSKTYPFTTNNSSPYYKRSARWDLKSAKGYQTIDYKQLHYRLVLVPQYDLPHEKARNSRRGRKIAASIVPPVTDRMAYRMGTNLAFWDVLHLLSNLIISSTTALHTYY
jgi:hypothetical protein